MPEARRSPRCHRGTCQHLKSSNPQKAIWNLPCDVGGIALTGDGLVLLALLGELVGPHRGRLEGFLWTKVVAVCYFCHDFCIELVQALLWCYTVTQLHLWKLVGNWKTPLKDGPIRILFSTPWLHNYSQSVYTYHGGHVQILVGSIIRLVVGAAMGKPLHHRAEDFKVQHFSMVRTWQIWKYQIKMLVWHILFNHSNFGVPWVCRNFNRLIFFR